MANIKCKWEDIKFNEFVKSQKWGKRHAELVSTSNKIKGSRDPETSSA
jgi:hypothetical protein